MMVSEVSDIPETPNQYVRPDDFQHPLELKNWAETTNKLETTVFLLHVLIDFVHELCDELYTFIAKKGSC